MPSEESLFFYGFAALMSVNLLASFAYVMGRERLVLTFRRSEAQLRHLFFGGKNIKRERAGDQ